MHVPDFDTLIEVAADLHVVAVLVEKKVQGQKEVYYLTEQFNNKRNYCRICYKGDTKTDFQTITFDLHRTSTVKDAEEHQGAGNPN